MPDQDKTREQLSAYLDGELSPAERDAVLRAVESDEQLAVELAELEATRQLVRGLSRQRAGEEFVTRVLARAERRHLLGSAGDAAPAARTGWVRWLASAAVILIAVGVGVVVMQFLQSPTFDPQAGRPAGRQGDSLVATVDHADAADETPEPVEVAFASPDETRVREMSARGARPPADAADDVAPLMPSNGIHSQPGAQLALGPMGLPRGGAAGTLGESRGVAAEEAVSPPEPAAAPTMARAGSASPETLARPEAPGAAVTPAPTAQPAEGGEARDLPAVAAAAGPATQPAAVSADEPSGQPLEVVTRNSRVAADLANARQELVYTDDLSAAQQQIEAALARNAVTVFDLGRELDAGRRLELQRAAQSANYYQLPPARTQVQYVAYVTPRQMTALANELAAIRSSQRVPQTPIVAGQPYVAIERASDGSLRLKQGGSSSEPARANDYRTRLLRRRRMLQPQVEPLVITLNQAGRTPTSAPAE